MSNDAVQGGADGGAAGADAGLAAVPIAVHERLRLAVRGGADAETRCAARHDERWGHRPVAPGGRRGRAGTRSVREPVRRGDGGAADADVVPAAGPISGTVAGSGRRGGRDARRCSARSATAPPRTDIRRGDGARGAGAGPAAGPIAGGCRCRVEAARTPGRDARLGTMRDDDRARRLRYSRMAVFNMRRTLGLLDSLSSPPAAAPPAYRSTPYQPANW